MTVRHFLDASYTLLVETYQNMGLNWIDALERVNHLEAKTPEPDQPHIDPSEAAVARQNEASFAQFQQMMGGVKL